MLDDLLGETGGAIAQFVLALIVVLALIMIVAWVVRRVGGGRFGATQPGQAELEIVDAIVIDQKRRLVLVRHGKLEHLLLIGGGSDEVVERSMIGGIPLTARVQASKSQDRSGEESPQEFRPADRFRTTGRYTGGVSRAGTLARGSSATATAGMAAANPAATSPMTTSATPTMKDGPESDLETDTASAPDMDASAKAAGHPMASGLEKGDRPSKGTDDPVKDGQNEDTGTPESATTTIPPLSPASPLAAAPLPASPAATTIPPMPAPPLDVSPPEAPRAKRDRPETDTLSAPAASIQPSAIAGAGLSDLDLERELEAALELDILPPAPTATSNPPADASDVTPVQAKPAPPIQTPIPAPVPATPVAPEPASPVIQPQKPQSADAPADPVSTLSQTGKTAVQPEPTPDLPIEPSRRTDPIAVAIPSRGPASNATSLTTSSQEEAVSASSTPDSPAPDPAPTSQEPLVDLSELLQTPQTPARTAPTDQAAVTTKPAAKAEKADDLDEEMRRLLGEIAGDEKGTDRTDRDG